MLWYCTAGKSNMSVERDYYQALDFIVKHFLLTSHAHPSCIVIRVSLQRVPLQLRSKWRIVRLQFIPCHRKTRFYLRLQHKFQLPTNETENGVYSFILLNKSRSNEKSLFYKLSLFYKYCHIEKNYLNILKNLK